MTSYIDHLSGSEVQDEADTHPKWIYRFEEGSAGMRSLLGGKGAGLAEMTRIGLPVPPGFTITTEACLDFLAHNQALPEGLWEHIIVEMNVLGQKMGRTFANPANPLLVSVRSGSKFSMPGMMDTILNLGLNDVSVKTLAEQTGDWRFAMDAYRRLIQMFGKVVLGIDGALFEEVIARAKQEAGVVADTDLSHLDWNKVITGFKAVIRSQTDQIFPQDPWVQLESAVRAVFQSWNGKRAVDYRNAVGISHDLGTACNIMAMVFGNMGSDSASGVAFTRNPSTGENTLYGEYLVNAQGEDVVSGARTPAKIAQMAWDLPEAHKTLLRIAETLECHYHEMQDIEFTVERGTLWMLQTRTGKRSATAAMKIAADMVRERLITEAEAVSRIEPNQIDQLLHPRFDENARKLAVRLASGINASPGAAVGTVVFDADEAERIAREEGKSVILVRPETNPDDVHGMLAAKGILTQHGGATSHAAVVARQLGKPCVAGCDAIRIDLDKRYFQVGDQTIYEHAVISIDGTTGEVFTGALPTVTPSFEELTELQVILRWADQISRLQVWANADDGDQALRARRFGARGIGLCRTEHMFLGERTELFQRAILAETDKEFHTILDEILLPLQQDDFLKIFKAMDGLPVIIRLLDPPLHEFLPSLEELIAEVSQMEAVDATNPNLAQKQKLLSTVREMHEINPMLGLRGCRLGIMQPALNVMQVQAIFEAACDATRGGIEVYPEVMIPLTSHINELKEIQPLLEATANEVMSRRGVNIPYKFGTMIEVPRAALTAGQLAELAQFFSFGTNDLTQMTYGISRDDAERKFLLSYVEKGILPQNPFQSIDQIGVGELMKLAIENGHKVRPDLEVGICGEHGGDPDSVEFCHQVGLDYVSCSPFRVPIARLAAAHAALHAMRASTQDL